MCDCSKEEGLQLDVVIGTCVTSGGTVRMWAWKIRCGPSETGLSTCSPGEAVHGRFHKSQLGRDEKGNVCGTLLPLAFPICF